MKKFFDKVPQVGEKVAIIGESSSIYNYIDEGVVTSIIDNVGGRNKIIKVESKSFAQSYFIGGDHYEGIDHVWSFHMMSESDNPYIKLYPYISQSEFEAERQHDENVQREYLRDAIIEKVKSLSLIELEYIDSILKEK